MAKEKKPEEKDEKTLEEETEEQEEETEEQEEEEEEEEEKPKRRRKRKASRDWGKDIAAIDSKVNGLEKGFADAIGVPPRYAFLAMLPFVALIAIIGKGLWDKYKERANG
jgi:hypothetical protein